MLIYAKLVLFSIIITYKPDVILNLFGNKI